MTKHKLHTGTGPFEIRTSKGLLRFWQSIKAWHFATPNGSQGSNLSMADSIRDAFEAEGLDGEEYGY